MHVICWAQVELVSLRPGGGVPLSFHAWCPRCGVRTSYWVHPHKGTEHLSKSLGLLLHLLTARWGPAGSKEVRWRGLLLGDHTAAKGSTESQVSQQSS